MWMKRNMCRSCWDMWRPGDPPSTIGGVFGDNCCICGSRNHDDIYMMMDEAKVQEISDEIAARRAASGTETSTNES